MFALVSIAAMVLLLGYMASTKEQRRLADERFKPIGRALGLVSAIIWAFILFYPKQH